MAHLAAVSHLDRCMRLDAACAYRESLPEQATARFREIAGIDSAPVESADRPRRRCRAEEWWARTAR